MTKIKEAPKRIVSEVSIYAEFYEEDRELANMGLKEYNEQLNKEEK